MMRASDDPIGVLDLLIEVLQKHEAKIDYITERLETVCEVLEEKFHIDWTPEDSEK